MINRHRLLIATVGIVAATVTTALVQVAARIAGLAGSHPDPATLLQHACLLAALVSTDCFVVAVLVAAVRVLRGRHPWEEPRSRGRRLVAYVATGLVGLAAAPASGAAAATRASVGAPLPGGPAAPTTAPDPTWHLSATTRGTSASAGNAEIRLVGGNTRAVPADPLPTIVVRRGDCLWDIVARALGPDATAAEVARAWPRWYAANRRVIGTNPNLLLPGQQLHAPQGVR